MRLNDAALSMPATQAPSLLDKDVGPLVTVHHVRLAHGRIEKTFGARVECRPDSAGPESHGGARDALNLHTGIQQIKCRLESAPSFGYRVSGDDSDLVASVRQGICLRGSHPTGAAKQ